MIRYYSSNWRKVGRPRTGKAKPKKSKSIDLQNNRRIIYSRDVKNIREQKLARLLVTLDYISQYFVEKGELPTIQQINKNLFRSYKTTKYYLSILFQINNLELITDELLLVNWNNAIVEHLRLGSSTLTDKVSPLTE